MRAAREQIPRRVHLTFDDGPDPVWTPRVAAELDRLGVRATFFVIGERAERHPEIVELLLADGHEVELHSMRHLDHTAATRAAVEDDAREALDVLRRLGVRPRRWRMPLGRIAPWTRAVARSHGLRLAGWSSDPKDWDGTLAGVLLERIAGELRPGAVVALHDGVVGDAPRADCAQTLELIEPLVGNVRLRGWDLAPLGPRRASLPPPGVRKMRRVLQVAGSHAATAVRSRRAAADPARRPFEISLVPESDLTDADHELLRALIAGAMKGGGEMYAERSWRHVRPEFRAVARIEGEIIGQVSAFRIGTRPPRVFYGIGDSVVRGDERGRGIGTQLSDTLRAEIRRRGAEVVLGDTTAHRAYNLRIGSAPVPRFRFHYERDGACHWHPNWVAKIYHPESRVRLELEEGDF